MQVKSKLLCSIHLQVREIEIGNRAEVRSSFITTTVWDESQVTPQGRHNNE